VIAWFPAVTLVITEIRVQFSVAQFVSPCSIGVIVQTHRGSRVYEGVSKSYRTGRLEREMQMVQLSVTKCSCIAVLWVSLVSFAAITLCVDSQRVFICCLFRYRLSPETFGYSLVYSRVRLELTLISTLVFVTWPRYSWISNIVETLVVLGVYRHA
jgi:hypothetical protein